VNKLSETKRGMVRGGVLGGISYSTCICPAQEMSLLHIRQVRGESELSETREKRGEKRSVNTANELPETKEGRGKKGSVKGNQ
jgi:hypothetical protein